MPRISISMARLSGSAAKESMERLSLDMFKTYKSNQKLLVEGDNIILCLFKFYYESGKTLHCLCIVLKFNLVHFQSKFCLKC